MNQRITAIAALGSLAATGALVAAGQQAQAGGDGPQGRAPSARAAAVTVASCDGGALLSTKSRMVSEPVTIADTGVNGQDQAIPGAGLTFTGPRSGTDTFVVDFSGETRVFGGGSSTWMGLEVQLDGRPIQPFADNGSPLAFASADLWEAHAAQFCVKVGPGRHTLRAKANLFNGSGGSVSGWLDDYTFTVQRFS